MYLEEVKTMGNAIDVRQELLEKGLAETNPEVSLEGAVGFKGSQQHPVA